VAFGSQRHVSGRNINVNSAMHHHLNFPTIGTVVKRAQIFFLFSDIRGVLIYSGFYLSTQLNRVDLFFTRPFLRLLRILLLDAIPIEPFNFVFVAERGKLQAA
jgi:hypothetical protein